MVLLKGDFLSISLAIFWLFKNHALSLINIASAIASGIRESAYNAAITSI